ncbi:glycosyltransferase [Phocaeicola coprophilus]|uniref:glycosyltransferase n=1 Tax=Phocaeicola coprophilus TaxID=387090 RepID=UPI0026DBC0FF|nr:glycosyltransferase [Phocaeicola coprophilus]
MNIVFTCCTDNYPLSFSANNTKDEFIAKGLKDCSITFINRLWGYKEKSSITEGETENKYKYYIFPKKSNKLITIIFNTISLFKILKRCKKNDEQNIMIIDTGYYIFFIIYVIYAKVLGYKILHIITEWPLAFKLGVVARFDAQLYVNSFGYFVDGILPISEALIEKTKKFKKPILKTPILGEYSKNINSQEGNYFVYCANAGYYRIIDFVINAFALYRKSHDNGKLFLVLYGKELAIKRVQEAIKNKYLIEYIEIVSKLSTEELTQLYANSIGLLIPLDPNSLQDKYRFSQKIAEYLATQTPIITCNVGEIPYYLKDKESCIIAEYTIESYAKAMEWIIDNREKAKEIGINGYKVGNKNFNYQIYGNQLIKFIEQL